ncbi:MAG: hypothetical protein HUU20_10770 [Pirellulales bacterium]|nr:hypothetical protein [Pirellulales bacterium]
MIGEEQKPAVKVVAEETDEILANPGMGWETFHRTCKADNNLPSWIPSTVQYARWGWRELEPQPGKVAYDFLDRVLKESHDSGQELAFWVMYGSPYKGRLDYPDWLKEIGGRILIAGRQRHDDDRLAPGAGSAVRPVRSTTPTKGDSPC